MTIRPERESDWPENENLTREAFWNVYRPGCLEHYVLHRLRKEDCFVPELDYVAELDGKLVASIVYARGTLTRDDGSRADMLLFGPVGVLPEYQRRGFGAQLIEYTLERAKELGYPAVVITGDPEYYGRFGFESASGRGIYYEGMERTEEAPFFMIKVLDEDAMKGVSGTYSDPPCYFPDEKDVDEFDRRFPAKTKERRPGQLV